MAAGRHFGFDPTGNSAVRSADLENPTLDTLDTKSIGWRVAEIWPFEIFQSVWMGPWVGRSSSVGGRLSVFILLTLISFLTQRKRSIWDHK